MDTQDNVVQIDRAGAQDLQPVETPASPPVAVPPEGPGTGPLPMPASTPMAQEPRPASPVLFVSFVGMTKKGKQRHGRAYLTGMFAFRSASQVQIAEQLIGENRGLTEVEILNWSVLEG